MPKLTSSLLAVVLAGTVACSGTATGLLPEHPTVSQHPAIQRVVSMSEVEWGPLNPARGVNGPKAGDLWGDRTAVGPSGFLVEFADGFESPPHIHNVSYRGVVISGLVHNDDPDADEVWLPAGSYWTQPKGDVHITAARGSRNLVYVEIEEGPYLVRPVVENFECGEVPVRIDESSLVWREAQGRHASERDPKVSHLWGDPQGDGPNGILAKLPTGFDGTMRASGSTLHAVVVQGRLHYRGPGETDERVLDPGSHFSSNGDSSHYLSCEPGEGCVVYVRSRGKVDVVPARSGS